MFDIFAISALFGYPFFLRIMLPGIIWTFVMIPMVIWLPERLFEGRLSTTVAIGVILAIGFIIVWIIDLLRGQIYLVYEGRRLWVSWIAQRLQTRLTKKVEGRYQCAEKEPNVGDELRKDIWHWLRMFPIGPDGMPRVVKPTLLGNVREAYEDYPLSRYGMDPVFYWYRIWLKVPTDVRKLYSLVSAEAQWLIYTSVVLIISSIWYFGLFLFTMFARHFEFEFLIESRIDSILLWPLGLLIIFSLIGSYLSYRFSINAHFRVGEYFKSVFDDFRGEFSISSISDLKNDASRYREAWAYLQYSLLRCQDCNKYYPKMDETCPYCSRSLTNNEK